MAETSASLPSPPLPAQPEPSGHTIPIEQAPIEADENVLEENDAVDEAYDSEDASSTATTSISSSVRDFTFENRRRYHKFKEGRYNFPNDEPEQEREDMKHAVAVHLLKGELHLAPLENPQAILDIGTGTGSWAIDVGDEYPGAEVTGIDLSPIQPAWVPPNVKFIVDDAESSWVQADDSIDLVHLRNMAVAIKDWGQLLERVYKALRPGGWVEIQEFRWVYDCDDGTMPADYSPVKMVSLIRDGLASFGVEMHAAERNEGRLRDAGFTEIVHDIKKVPVGPWAKDPGLKTVGMYNRSVIYDGLQAITLGPLTRGLGWTPEEVELFLVKVRKDLRDTSVHSFVHFHTLYGRKPQLKV